MSVTIAQAKGDANEPDTYLPLSRWHPDGSVGNLSFHTMLQYASVEKDKGVPVTDIQKYDFSLNWVVVPKITFLTNYSIIKEDSFRYDISAGLKYYLSNPLDKNHRRNPDGSIGGLSVSLLGGLRYTNSATKVSKFVGDFMVTLPVSYSMTFQGGYRYFEQIEATDVQQGYLSLFFYFSPYKPDSAFVNPDGPVGNLALKITGGGSSNGAFGQLIFIFPLNNNLSLKTSFRGEKMDSPYKQSLLGGLGFSYYFSN
ncbi:MAG: hypothetical protein GXO93_06785 [FCB group bacterium]|nr:hypothetical protein [FCB group bacterium]